jgi:glutathione peroxidase
MSMSRRTTLSALAGIAACATRAGAATDPGLAWQFKMTAIDDGMLDFATLRGKVLLVVNTASYCGYTPQYKQLEALHRALSPKGFAVVGIPSQDFGQEKGSNAEVAQFCELTYGVEFPMAGLSKVTGSQAAPFYKWVRAQTGWEPKWNFYKVLISRQGTILGTYGSDVLPDTGPLRDAIDKAVAAPAVS